MASRRSARRSRPLLRWVVLGGLCLAALAYYQPLRTYLHTRGTVARREADVRQLRDQHRQLRRLVAASSSDAELAREARRLGLVKPGERLFIVKGIDGWLSRHANVGRGG